MNGVPGSVSAISWRNDDTHHLRVYRNSGDRIVERCYDDPDGGWFSDPEGKWYDGAFSQPGTSVGATSLVDGHGHDHIRLYVGNGGQIVEHCWDTDHWYQGQFSTAGVSASAVAWLTTEADGATIPPPNDPAGMPTTSYAQVVHIRLYVADGDSGVVEHCFDKDRWVTGGY